MSLVPNCSPVMGRGGIRSEASCLRKRANRATSRTLGRESDLELSDLEISVGLRI